MTRRLATTLAQLLLALSIAGCAAAPRQTPPPGELIPGPILTFRWASERDGVPILCTASAAVNPVRGVFEGDPTRSSGVAWLRAPDGMQLTVAWPAGFQFVPEAVLLDQTGRVVARHGQHVELGQVNLGEADGTPADPYIAHGLVFDGCYSVAP